MKHLVKFNESYTDTHWKNRDERDSDLEYVRLIFSDLEDDDINVNVQGHNLTRHSYIEVTIQPNRPEINWATGGNFMKWSNIEYKFNQLMEIMGNRYDIENIKVVLRFGFGDNTKDNSTVKYYSLQEVINGNGIKMDNDKSPISAINLLMKVIPSKIV